MSGKFYRKDATLGGRLASKATGVSPSGFARICVFAVTESACGEGLGLLGAAAEEGDEDDRA